ncbi:MAG TPA: hypothetical protein QF873_02955 [Patescibacteria group bacterium]|nr:hypothetical protein [Patescibacteria group bacterium]
MKFIKELVLGLVLAAVLVPGCAWIDQERSFPGELMEDSRAQQVIDLKDDICADEYEMLYGPDALQDVSAEMLVEDWAKHDKLVSALESDHGVSFGSIPWFRPKARLALARQQGVIGLVGGQWYCGKRY